MSSYYFCACTTVNDFNGCTGSCRRKQRMRRSRKTPQNPKQRSSSPSHADEDPENQTSHASNVYLSVGPTILNNFTFVINPRTEAEDVDFGGFRSPAQTQNAAFNETLSSNNKLRRSSPKGYDDIQFREFDSDSSQDHDIFTQETQVLECSESSQNPSQHSQDEELQDWDAYSSSSISSLASDQNASIHIQSRLSCVWKMVISVLQLWICVFLVFILGARPGYIRNLRRCLTVSEQMNVFNQPGQPDVFVESEDEEENLR